MPNSMIDARLSLESAKLNFQLAQFHYSSGIGLDINTHKPKLQLRRQIERKDLDGQISEMFYVTLGTESDVDSDMAIAFWYTDEAAVEVEATILEIKRRNVSLELRHTNTIRGRISDITMKRLYPDLEMPEGSTFETIRHNNLNSQIVTKNKLKALESDRTIAEFMFRPYLVSIDLLFNDKFNQFSQSKKESMLKDLDGFASKYFPGKAESLLVETPLSEADYSYVIYIDHYSDLMDYAGLLVKESPMAQYTHNKFSDAIICNHTSIETLENPLSMIRRS